VPQFEKRALLAERKAQEWQQSSADLRKQNDRLDKARCLGVRDKGYLGTHCALTPTVVCSQEVATLQLRTERLQHVAGVAEDQILRQEEVIRKLQYTLQSSDGGTRALKAAACDVDVTRLREQLASQQKELNDIAACVHAAAGISQRHEDARAADVKAELAAVLRRASGQRDGGSPTASAQRACRLQEERSAVEVLNAQLAVHEMESQLAALTREKDALLDYVEELQVREGLRVGVTCVLEMR